MKTLHGKGTKRCQYDISGPRCKRCAKWLLQHKPDEYVRVCTQHRDKLVAEREVPVKSSVEVDSSPAPKDSLWVAIKEELSKIDDEYSRAMKAFKNGR